MPLLSPGDTFPPITITTEGHEQLVVPDFFDGGFGAVLFYRGSWCPYCTAQLRAFQRAQDALSEVGTRVVALSVDDQATTAKLIAQHGLSFPIGHSADAHMIAEATGAFVNPGPRFIQSTGFILDPAGKVMISVYSSGAIGRLLPEDVIGMIAAVNHIEPVPRRVRAMLGGAVVVDTVAARYVWEWPYYSQFYLPLADVAAGVLLDEQHRQQFSRGLARRHQLAVGDQSRPGAAWVYGEDALPGLADTVRFDWDALDCWFEEDEEVFVHPRNPYTRVDAVRSTRAVRIELDGLLLAESTAPVMVFETGLPTRYYGPHPGQLRASAAYRHRVLCPYKGNTSGYWSVRAGSTVHPDLAGLQLPHPPPAAHHRAHHLLQRESRRTPRRPGTAAPGHPLSFDSHIRGERRLGTGGAKSAAPRTADVPAQDAAVPSTTR